MQDSRVESPFHRGERAVQSRVGVRDRVEQVGLRVIRDHMPDEHRELFEKLPYVVLGVQDHEERLWATMLSGPAGFIRTPDARTLAIASRPERDDPAHDGVAIGRKVGLLGIELHTRRRNRVNGCVVAAPGSGLTIQVEQSFGNCPKYIQPRRPVEHGGSPSAPREHEAEAALLSVEARELISRSDTFFIATASEHAQAAASTGDARSEGVDVSHRGGPRGFIRVTQELERTRIAWPDFRGNSLFNTLGNLAVNPRAGLLFVDFQAGRALALTGTARVDWDVPAIQTTPPTERSVLFDVSEGVWLFGTVPRQWADSI